MHLNDGNNRSNVAGGVDANSDSNSFNSGVGGSFERPPSFAAGLRRRVPSLARIGHVNSGKELPFRWRYDTNDC